MRTSRKHVEAVFALLVSASGHRLAESWDDVGGWSLDYNPTYGGYVVTEVVNEHGGISHPLGEQRRPAGEMWSAIHFALRVLESVR